MSISDNTLLCRAAQWADRHQLFLLLLFALAIRCVGILWGGVHSDESIGAPARVLTGQLVPNQHFYPPLLNYIVAVGFAGMFAFGIAIGIWHSAADFQDQYFNDPTAFIFVLRFCVAFIAALAAPLVAMIATRLSMGRVQSFVAGLIMALLPLSVWFSHFGKVDLGVSTGLLLACWALIGYGNLSTTRDVIWFAVGITLALSFKHSAIFIAAPMVMGFFLLPRVNDRLKWSEVFRHAGLFSCVVGGLWIVLNVGLWLDLRNFLDYQAVQSAMAIRSVSINKAFTAMYDVVGSNVKGATPLLMIAYLLVPFLWRRTDVIIIWIAVAIGVLSTALISGDRASPQIYLPQCVLAAMLGSLLILHATRRPDWRRKTSLVLLLICVSNLLFWSVIIKQQALARSVSSEVADILRNVPNVENMQIIGSGVKSLGLPISRSAVQETTARDERLAAKYGLVLPERNTPLPEGDVGAYHIRSLPFAMGGLEIYDEDELETIKPYAWPIQEEEWNLQFWTDRGYTLFVIGNLEAMLSSSIEPYRQLHAEIVQSCDLIGEARTTKPLFFEWDTSVFSCQTL